MHKLQLTENFKQYLHFSCPQNLQSFNNGKISFTKIWYSFSNSLFFPKIGSISKRRKITLKKKKKINILKLNYNICQVLLLNNQVLIRTNSKIIP